MDIFLVLPEAQHSKPAAVYPAQPLSIQSSCDSSWSTTCTATNISSAAHVKIDTTKTLLVHFEHCLLYYLTSNHILKPLSSQQTQAGPAISTFVLINKEIGEVFCVLVWIKKLYMNGEPQNQWWIKWRFSLLQCRLFDVTVAVLLLTFISLIF